MVAANSTQFQHTSVDEFVVIFGMLLLIVGTIGNLLTLAVIWAYKAMRPTSRFLFSLLAGVDQGALMFAEIRYWIMAYSGFDIRNINLVVCKVHIYFTYTFVNMSVWLPCIISIERFFFTFFPLQKHPCKEMRFIVLAVLVGFLGNCVKNAFLIARNYIQGKCEANNHHIFILNVIDCVMSYMIPFSVTLLSTFLLLCKIFQQKNQVSDATSKVSHQSRLRTATAMLVGIVAAQLLLGTPGILFSVIHSGNHAKYLHDELRDNIYTALLTITITNNAINFYIYFFSTRAFRMVFYSLFRSSKKTPSISLAPTVHKSTASKIENE